MGAANLSNTIVANSTGGDCSISGGSLNADHSLIEDGGCGVSAGSNGNLTGDPALGPLANNGCVAPGPGGCVNTQALLAGSPAIDAGSLSACTSAPVNGVDQRGFSRASPCDMGAYEFGAGVASAPAAPVPALSDWGVLLTSMTLILSAVVAMRRQRG